MGFGWYFPAYFSPIFPPKLADHPPLGSPPARTLEATTKDELKNVMVGNWKRQKYIVAALDRRRRTTHLARPSPSRNKATQTTGSRPTRSVRRKSTPRCDDPESKLTTGTAVKTLQHGCHQLRRRKGSPGDIMDPVRVLLEPVPERVEERSREEVPQLLLCEVQLRLSHRPMSEDGGHQSRRRRGTLLNGRVPPRDSAGSSGDFAAVPKSKHKLAGHRN